MNSQVRQALMQAGKRRVQGDPFFSSTFFIGQFDTSFTATGALWSGTPSNSGVSLVSGSLFGTHAASFNGTNAYLYSCPSWTANNFTFEVVVSMGVGEGGPTFNTNINYGFGTTLGIYRTASTYDITYYHTNQFDNMQTFSHSHSDATDGFKVIAISFNIVTHTMFLHINGVFVRSWSPVYSIENVRVMGDSVIGRSLKTPTLYYKGLIDACRATAACRYSATDYSLAPFPIQ